MNERPIADRRALITRRAVVSGLSAVAVSPSLSSEAALASPAVMSGVEISSVTDGTRDLLARSRMLLDLIENLLDRVGEIERDRSFPDFKTQITVLAARTCDLDDRSLGLEEATGELRRSVGALLADAIEAYDHDRGSAEIIARMLTEREKRKRG